MDLYKGRMIVSVGSVCVLDEPWLELLADRFLLLLLLLLLLLSRKNSGVRLFCFLNKRQFSILLPKSAKASLKS